MNWEFALVGVVLVLSFVYWFEKTKWHKKTKAELDEMIYCTSWKLIGYALPELHRRNIDLTEYGPTIFALLVHENKLMRVTIKDYVAFYYPTEYELIKDIDFSKDLINYESKVEELLGLK